jgi:hypothetical protein
MWNNKDLEEDFDIIIEDGLHTFNANVCFFENSIHKLKSGGYYIIEDIVITDKHLFINKINNEWNKKYPDYTFNLVEVPSLVNIHDNNLLIIYKKEI